MIDEILTPVRVEHEINPVDPRVFKIARYTCEFIGLGGLAKVSIQGEGQNIWFDIGKRYRMTIEEVTE